MQSEVAAWDELSGRLEAIERVDIRSRAAGTVQAVHFREGALVKSGDLLVTIDPAPYAAEVEPASLLEILKVSNVFAASSPTNET